MQCRHRMAFAVGHFLNDLCSAVWFTYTLVFFQGVINLSTVTAGALILIGQIADGLSTPLIGYLCDKSQTAAFHNRAGEAIHRRGGGRLEWHMAGSILVIASFSFIYSPVYIKSVDTDWTKFIYYGFFIVLFQIGWACVQISHLALVNDLTDDPQERVLLISWRYLFTVVANLCVYTSMVFLLKAFSPKARDVYYADTGHENNDNHFTCGRACAFLLHMFSGEGRDFGPADAVTFKVLAYVTLGLGALSTTAFHLGLRVSGPVDNYETNGGGRTADGERTRLLASLASDGDHREDSSISSSDLDEGEYAPVVSGPFSWFKEPLFLVLSPIYMFVRLIINISQVYITLYLIDSLLITKHSIALVPLTIYVVSAITSVSQKLIHDRMNRETACCLGLGCVLVFSFSCLFPGSPQPSIPLVYISAGFLGVGCTVLLVSSLAMVGDLVGNNQATGGFVYGLMSLTDKLANGLVVQIAQAIHSKTEVKPGEKDPFYQRVESYGMMGFVAVATLLLLNQCAIKRCLRNRTRFVRGPTIIEEPSAPPSYGSLDI